MAESSYYFLNKICKNSSLWFVGASFFTRKWPKKEAKAIAEIFRIASRQRIEAEAFFYYKG
jgi:hypothetical protein